MKITTLRSWWIRWTTDERAGPLTVAAVVAALALFAVWSGVKSRVATPPPILRNPG